MLKRRISLIIATVLVMAVISGCTLGGEDQVAKVGADKITKAEFSFFLKNAENRIISLFGNTPVDWSQKIQNVTAEEYAKQIALESATEMKIQVAKAKEANLSLSKEEISNLNANIDESVKKLGTTGIDQEKALKEQTGVNVSQLKTIYRDITLAQKYVKSVEDSTKYTDADLKAYYDANKDGLYKVTVGHILFMTIDENNQPLSQEKQDAAKKSAEDVLAKVNDNGDFAALAKQYSEDPGSKDSGGAYTLTMNDSYVDEFKNWALDPSRKVGDTGIVQTTYGYHVMKMDKIFSYDEILPDVKTNFLSKAYFDNLTAWKKEAKYAVEKNAKVYDAIKVSSK